MTGLTLLTLALLLWALRELVVGALVWRRRRAVRQQRVAEQRRGGHVP